MSRGSLTPVAVCPADSTSRTKGRTISQTTKHHITIRGKPGVATQAKAKAQREKPLLDDQTSQRLASPAAPTGRSWARSLSQNGYGVPNHQPD